MRNDDAGHFERLDCIVDLMLLANVEVAGSLVQKQNAGFFVKSAREQYALFLPPR